MHRSIRLWHHQYDLSYSFQHVRPPSKQYLTIGTPRTSTDQKGDHRLKCLTECTLNVSLMKVLSIFCQWNLHAWLWSSYLLIPTSSSHEVKTSNIHAQATSYLILVVPVWEFVLLDSCREELQECMNGHKMLYTIVQEKLVMAVFYEEMSMHVPVPSRLAPWEPDHYWSSRNAYYHPGLQWAASAM